MDKNNPILIALKAAQAAFRAGDHDQALKACLTVLEHVPNHPMAHLMSGLLQQQAGEYSEAIRHLRFAVAHDPKDMDARDALGMCLLALGRHAEAMPHLRQVVAAQPDNANARYNLGRCLLDLRNYAEAERVYQEHIERNPGDAEAFNHLGLARLAKGQAAAAAQCFQTAIQLNEHEPLFHANFAQALAQQGKAVDADKHYSRAVELDPANAGFRVQHGWFLVWSGNIVKAEDRFREALQREPEHERGAAGLAAVLHRRRELDVGLSVLRPFISAVHPEPKVAVSYAKLSHHKGTPEQALPVVRRAIRPGVAKLQEASLRFAEGDLLDAMGQVDEAFAAYQRANAAQGLRYDADAHEAFVDAIIRVFTAELFAALPKPSIDTSASVLVCGMPRSGTSLIQQILDTHPDIHGAGELDDLPTIAQGLRHYVQGDDRYPELVPQMSEALIEQLAQARMESLRRASELPLVVDKLPHNFMHLGLAAVLTPQARVIHAVRDPVDTCLSCYFQHFAGPANAFSSRLDALSSYYAQYHRLMKHWDAVLPLEMMTVRYEDVVANTEQASQQLLSFLGRAWDPAVLDFHKSARVCATASYAQVQQPVYSTSVGRAERYRHRIGELVAVAQLRQ